MKILTNKLLQILLSECNSRGQSLKLKRHENGFTIGFRLTDCY